MQMKKKRVVLSLIIGLVISLSCSISDNFLVSTPTQTSLPPTATFTPNPPTLTSTPTLGAGNLSAGWQHTCVVTPDGGVKCWGANEWGQLGDGTKKNRSAPVDVTGLGFQAKSVAAGLYHTCALSIDGHVKCWGGNGNGQLGNGTNNNSLSPVEVAGLDEKVVALAAGASHTCVVTQSRGMVCWGYNDSGQLGDGTTVDSNIPVGVVGLSEGVTAIALGNAGHTCAVTSGGGLKCWGWNAAGQVGDGTKTNRSIPVEVDGLIDVIGATAGYSHTCVLTRDGKDLCWGENKYGQLGNGTRQESSSPVESGDIPGKVIQLVAGSIHTCALTEDGRTFCWGGNEWGQLGDGSTTGRLQPVPILSTGAVITAISIGGIHSCGLTAGGDVLCWGGNEAGQLGDGSIDNSNFPVKVIGLVE
jgi:alpha-tubulin suppressor-like RCC1 family protein